MARPSIPHNVLRSMVLGQSINFAEEHVPHCPRRVLGAIDTAALQFGDDVLHDVLEGPRV